MKCPRTLYPTKCKHAIRHVNGTDNPPFNVLDYRSSFTFFDDIQTQLFLETEPSFESLDFLVLLPGLQILNLFQTQL